MTVRDADGRAVKDEDIVRWRLWLTSLVRVGKLDDPKLAESGGRVPDDLKA